MTAEARKQRAWEMLRRGEHEQAAAEYEWLWRNIPVSAPQLGAYRAIALPREVHTLCEANAAATRRFERLREEAFQEAEGLPALDSDARLDWIVLNQVLRHTAESVAWLEVNDLTTLSDRRLATFLQHLTPALAEHGKWKQIGRLQRAPLRMIQALQETVRLTMRSAEKNGRDQDPRTAEPWRFFRDQAVLLYRSLLAADRASEAEIVFEEAIKFDSDPDLATMLVQAGSAADGERVSQSS